MFLNFDGKKGGSNVGIDLIFKMSLLVLCLIIKMKIIDCLINLVSQSKNKLFLNSMVNKKSANNHGNFQVSYSL